MNHTRVSTAAPLIIDSQRKAHPLRVQEFWLHRHILYFLVWKDVKVRYKQTLIGGFWVLLQPFLEMVVLSIVFGEFFARSGSNVPYPLFVYAGILPWTYFSVSLTSGASSVVANADLMKRTYFPRMLIPLSSAIAKMVDLLMSLVILLGLMLYYDMPAGLPIVLLPFLLALLILTSAALSLWLSALHAAYRDVVLFLPYFLRIGMFLTPVIYPVSIVPEDWRVLLYLNPLTGIIEAFRAIILRETLVEPNHLLFTTGITLVIFASGALFFARAERKMLDVI